MADDETIVRMFAGQTLAVSALAEALVRAGVIEADKLISLLETVSTELFSSRSGEIELAPLEAMIGLLRKHAKPSGSPPPSH